VDVLALSLWVRWLVAVAIFLAVLALGVGFARAIAASRPRERVEPEDVASLDVFFVCGECGTEFKVTRLGEVQVPRHCGEPMLVDRRPRARPLGGEPSLN
jgi:hypothetical protein